MITLPLKKSIPARWSDHIGPMLVQIYGTAADFKQELEAMNRLRDSAIGVSPNSSGRDLLFRYFAQIELLALHIPTNPSKVEFTWYELYEDECCSQYSVAFEKACILYNLAATLGTLGVEAWQAQDYKQAYHDLSCAAGVLDFISTNFLHAASVDNQPATLSILSKLMLAQAQHCFFLKAATPGSASAPKPNRGLLAKLGMSACALYEEANRGLKMLFDEMHWGEKGVPKQLDTTISEVRAQCYLYQAQLFEDKHEYGDAIACLQEARRLITDKRELDDLNVRIKALDRDNNLIYHQRIPAVVPVIAQTDVAKPLPLASIYSSQEDASRVVGRDIFEKVVPIKVHEKASLYSEMTAQFLRDQQEKADIANLELDSALEYMDLPSSISRLRVTKAELAQVPSEILEYSATVRKSPPLRAEDFKFDEQRRMILSLGASSSGGTQSTNTIRESLVLAGKTDTELLSMFNSVASDLQTLRNLDLLLKAYKDAAYNEQSSSEPPTPAVSLLDLDDSSQSGQTSTEAASIFDGDLDRVSGLVSKLHKIKTERQSTLGDLREKVRNDDVTQAIIANQDTADIEKQVFEPEIKKFEPLVRRLDATIRLQKSVLNEAVGMWKQLLASPTAKKRQEEQRIAQENVEILSAKLGQAFVTFEALQQGAQRAAAFYADLEKQALGINSISSPGAYQSPQLPPTLPQKPPKIPAKPQWDGLNGYDTPSAYNPSMYR